MHGKIVKNQIFRSFIHTVLSTKYSNLYYYMQIHSKKNQFKNDTYHLPFHRHSSVVVARKTSPAQIASKYV